MCGRITLTTSGGEGLASLLEAELDPEDAKSYRPRYNVAPTDRHWLVRLVADHRKLVPATWGVPRPGKSLAINARAEHVGRAPDFREAYKSRRCVVSSDGFFEWTGPKKARRPIWFHAPDGGLVLLAGVFEEAPEALPRFTVLTTRPNDLVARVHDRMPVVLSKESARRWLVAPDRDVLGPAPDDALVATEVDPRVNSVANDDPACLEPPPRPASAEGVQIDLF
jgi:putative SOS response-associated peptidase YedK